MGILSAPSNVEKGEILNTCLCFPQIKKILKNQNFIGTNVCVSCQFHPKLTTTKKQLIKKNVTFFLVCSSRKDVKIRGEKDRSAKNKMNAAKDGC